MSDYDAEMYESFSSRVRRQVQSLRVILDSLQAKSRERVWLRHQTSGELDDTKLIEGLAGERAIYKKRGDEEPEVLHDSVTYVTKSFSLRQGKSILEIAVFCVLLCFVLFIWTIFDQP